MNEINLKTSLIDIIEYTKDNESITKAFLKANSVIKQFNTPYCSISGGKDSDVMLDIIYRVDYTKKVKYVFFDTGIEYNATKQHLDYLENKYDITIERLKSVKSIPISCKEYGEPFLNKRVSDMMSRLQRHNFQWEDDTFENLCTKYPRCQSALKWWCSAWGNGTSHFDIVQNKYLKEFIMSNPPTFNISCKCCNYAKKNTGKYYTKCNNNDLCITGIRKFECGTRRDVYKSCFDNNKISGDISYYRPLFWFTNKDIEIYSKIFNIKHSDCYEIYGLKRTGCVGCPYNRKLLDELNVIETYEPNLSKAVNNIFKNSYDYTKRYKEFAMQQRTLQ